MVARGGLSFDLLVSASLRGGITRVRQDAKPSRQDAGAPQQGILYLSPWTAGGRPPRGGSSVRQEVGAEEDEQGEEEEQQGEAELDGEGVLFLELDERFAAQAAIG